MIPRVAAGSMNDAPFSASKAGKFQTAGSEMSPRT